MSLEAMIQVGLFILTATTMLVLQKFSKRAFGKDRPNNHSSRHFFEGTHLLARARSTSPRSQSIDYAKKALIETEKGYQSSALKSLDVALSPSWLKSLSEKELAKALIKRAELKIAVNRKRRLDSTVEDLLEVVHLGGDDSKSFCLLDQCYEWKEMKDDARQAFEKALTVNPESYPTHNELDPLS